MEKENWLLEETLLHEKYQIKKVLGPVSYTHLDVYKRQDES